MAYWEYKMEMLKWVSSSSPRAESFMKSTREQANK
jgi:hypothetical protein